MVITYGPKKEYKVDRKKCEFCTTLGITPAFTVERGKRLRINTLTFPPNIISGVQRVSRESRNSKGEMPLAGPPTAACSQSWRRLC